MSNAGAGGPGAGGDPNGFGQWLAGLPAAAQASIMRVMQNANPVSPANAATADSVSRAPNPLSNPSPVPAALAAGGPSVPVGAVPPMGTAPIGGGPGMTMQSPTGIVPGGGTSGGGGATTAYNGAPPIGGGPGNTMEAPTGPQNIPIGGGPGNVMQAPSGTPAHVRARINPRATALAPAAGGGALPGYYAPTTGNARGATWSPYTDPNDPRIFRGPLAR